MIRLRLIALLISFPAFVFADDYALEYNSAAGELSFPEDVQIEEIEEGTKYRIYDAISDFRIIERRLDVDEAEKNEILATLNLAAEHRAMVLVKEFATDAVSIPVIQLPAHDVEITVAEKPIFDAPLVRRLKSKWIAFRHRPTDAYLGSVCLGCSNGERERWISAFTNKLNQFEEVEVNFNKSLEDVIQPVSEPRLFDPRTLTLQAVIDAKTRKPHAIQVMSIVNTTLPESDRREILEPTGKVAPPFRMGDFIYYAPEDVGEGRTELSVLRISDPSLDGVQAKPVVVLDHFRFYKIFGRRLTGKIFEGYQEVLRTMARKIAGAIEEEKMLSLHLDRATTIEMVLALSDHDIPTP